jgi:hypothetical protein
MNAYSSQHNPEDTFSRRLEDLMIDFEVEVRHAVAYIDAEIVPPLRREAGVLARVLSGHLDRIADRLHPQTETDGKQG